MSVIVLPRYAFIKAWEWGGYGKPHPVVGGDDMWVNDPAKNLLQREVDGILEKTGLALNGVPNPEFRRKLAVLARGERECYAWISHQGESGAALVATVGSEAVRVVRDEKVVLLDSVRPDDLAGALVDALPEVGGAEIASIVIPASQYTEDRPARPDEYQLEMDTRYRRPDPAARVRELMAAPCTGRHQLYAAARDRSGQRRRGRPVTVTDLVHGGRILTYVSRPPSGEPQLNCVSGTRRAIVSALGGAH